MAIGERLKELRGSHVSRTNASADWLEARARGPPLGCFFWRGGAQLAHCCEGNAPLGAAGGQTSRLVRVEEEGQAANAAHVCARGLGHVPMEPG